MVAIRCTHRASESGVTKATTEVLRSSPRSRPSVHATGKTHDLGGSGLLVGRCSLPDAAWMGRHEAKENDVVLVWGGAGGLGSMAIQIARAAGAIRLPWLTGQISLSFVRALVRRVV